MNDPILPPPIHPPDDTSTCDDLPPWAREAHPAPVDTHDSEALRALVDRHLRAWFGSDDAAVRFIVPGAHAVVASGDGGVTWWACTAHCDGRFQTKEHPTLSDASAWAWHQVRP